MALSDPTPTLQRGNVAIGSSAVLGDERASAVSWGAIFAGAAGAAALSLILLLLGVGLGLSSVSPWAQAGVAAGTIGVSAILWLTFTQLAASGMGGYLAGRLRTRWAAVHTDEVYFRDTAHGFLAWSVAALVSAALLGSTISAIVGGAAQAGASAVGTAASTLAGAGGAAAGASGASGSTDESGPLAYYTDLLVRRPAASTAPAATASDAASSPLAAPAGTGNAAPPTAEIGRIYATALKSGALAPEDARYVGQLVAQRTGIAQPEAEQRVNDTFRRLQTTLQDAKTAATAAADKARKASAYAALWLFVSLLAGAFVASWAATFGGRRRDL